MFSAEGSVGKCVMFVNPYERLVTNIHGIVLSKQDHNTVESAFVCCFLRYLRTQNVLDYIAVGGQGGSLAEKYWPSVRIPYFPHNKREQITGLYADSAFYQNAAPSLENLVPFDDVVNSRLGILHLDKQVKALKVQVNASIDLLVQGQAVPIDFGFLADF